MSTDVICAYVVKGLINSAYRWRPQERPLFDNKLGAFVQRSISANGAEPAVSRSCERPLSAIRSFNAAWALCVRPGKNWEMGGSGRTKEARPCPKPSPSTAASGKRLGTRAGLSANSALSNQRKSGIFGHAFKLRPAGATSQCSTWRSTANYGAAILSV